MEMDVCSVTANALNWICARASAAVKVTGSRPGRKLIRRAAFPFTVTALICIGAATEDAFMSGSSFSAS